MQNVLTLESNKYAIKIENFEGPLDLLCHLIDKNKMNIYDIKISEIADQYIEYINQSFNGDAFNLEGDELTPKINEWVNEKTSGFLRETAFLLTYLIKDSLWKAIYCCEKYLFN